MIKEKLKLDTEVKIEKAHCVGKPHASFEIVEDGSRKKILSHPTCMLEVEGSFSASWKKVKSSKPKKEIRFLEDLLAKTLQRRGDQIPKLIAERKKG